MPKKPTNIIKPIDADMNDVVDSIVAPEKNSNNSDYNRKNTNSVAAYQGEQATAYFRNEIVIENYEIGFIQLVSYPGSSAPHIEYEITDSTFRNKGIMSVHLSTYLSKCKELEIFQIVAVVEQDNQPSIKLLRRSGFVQVQRASGLISFITDLRHDTDTLNQIAKQVNHRRLLARKDY